MKIVFSEELKVFSCKNFWNLFEKSLKDSEKSDLWPGNLSSVKCKRVNKGGVLNVNYNFLFWKSSVEYEIVDYKKNKFLIYSPGKNHALKGKVKVSVKKLKNDCFLFWSGEYTNACLFHVLFFKLYAFLFFKALNKNVKRLIR